MSEKKMPESICIDPVSFEHLLNCLANQKWIHERLPADAKETQRVIDEAWKKGMEMLSKHIQKQK